MKSDTSFILPNTYICFSIGLFSGLLFYGALFFSNQHLHVSLSRMLGPISTNTSAVFVYVLLYILFFWGLTTIFYKSFMLRSERAALTLVEKNFDGARIISQRSEIDTLKSNLTHGPKTKKMRETELVRILLFLIDHCLITGTSQRVMEIFNRRLDTLANHIESSYSILRYIAWAIPSLGFIGTVMGIGSALSLAGLATEDMTLVTRPLGMAFDTTLIALIESLILMFFLHSMQRKEEDLLNSIDLFCQEKFIINLRLE